ncbi:MAG: hypothetical protein K6V73_11775 [Firmicutes bacterium]|nr:hypothetical protein [Bacillota bacterium]
MSAPPTPARPWALTLARLALAAIFLYFGAGELVQPGPWVGYLPPLFAGQVAVDLVLVHGFVLFVAGAALAAGAYPRVVLPLSVLLMATVAADLLLRSGPSAIWMRDLGLTALALALWADGGGWTVHDLGAHPSSPAHDPDRRPGALAR